MALHNTEELKAVPTSAIEREIHDPEAETYEGDLIIHFGSLPNYCGEVSGFAAVIESDQSIGLLSAAAKVPRQDIPPGGEQGARCAVNVVRGAAAFEAMGKDGDAIRALSRPVEIEKVSVCEFDSLALKLDAAAIGQEHWQDGLDVRIA